MANDAKYQTYQQTNISDFNTGYELVEDNTEYEYRTIWTFIGGTAIPTYKRRKFQTKTYEAILTESFTNEPTAYNHNAVIPDGSQEHPYPNPDSLDLTKWKVQSCEYTKSLSTPLSRDVRVTYIRQWDWETYTLS